MARRRRERKDASSTSEGKVHTARRSRDTTGDRQDRVDQVSTPNVALGAIIDTISSRLYHGDAHRVSRRAHERNAFEAAETIKANLAARSNSVAAL
jgi:hypothetical protein